MGKIKEILTDSMIETEGLNEDQLKNVVADKNMKLVAIKNVTDKVISDLEIMITNIENKGDSEEFRRILEELKRIKKI